MSSSVLGKALVEIDGDSSKLDRELDKVKGKAQGFGGVMKTALGTAAGFAAAQMGLQGVSGAFDFLVGNAASFEAALDGVQAATGATEADMASMRKEALRIGKDSSKSASEAVEAFGELAKAGMAVEEILAGGADAAVALAEATGIDVPRAAVLVSNALNTWKGSGMEAADAANLFAKAANASAISVDDLGMSLSAVGPVAQAAGLSMEDFAVAMGLMGNNAMRGSDAGTSLKAFISGFTPVSDKAATSMANLGFSAFDAAGNFEKMPVIIDRLAKSLEGMTEEQKAATLELWFGSDGVRAANILLKEGVAGWDGFTQAMAEAPDVAEQARIRMANLSGQMEQFKGSMETISITLGTMLLPYLNELATSGTQMANSALAWMEANEQDIQRTIGVIVEGLSTMIGFIRDLFAAMPSEMDIVAILGLAALATMLIPGGPILLGFALLTIAIGTLATDIDKLPGPLLNIRLKMMEWRLEILNLAEDLTTVFGIELPGVGDRIDENIRKTELQIKAITQEREARDRQSEALQRNQEWLDKNGNSVDGLKDKLLAEWRAMTDGEPPRGKLNDDLQLLYDRAIEAGVSAEELGVDVNRLTGATSDLLPPLAEGVRLSDNLAEAAMGVTQSVLPAAGALKEAMAAAFGAGDGFRNAAEGEDSITNRSGAAIGAMQNIAGAAREAGGAADAAGSSFQRMLATAEDSSRRAVEAAERAQVAAQAGTPSGYAAGGLPTPGEVSIVGERGWEFFIPQERGRVLSHEDSMQAIREAFDGGGGEGVVVNMPNATINARDEADAMQAAGTIGWGISTAVAMRGAR